tara:strand:+ start:596 stop:1198 length:603 start_codon:yes stop_codon:yes gene_type:complete
MISNKIKIRIVLLFSLLISMSCDSRVIEVSEKSVKNENKNMNAENLYAMQATNLEGETIELSSYAGKITLLVNVASKCGYTKQYADLQQLNDEYAEQGFAVIGFPCNDFGKQEPGDAQDISACAAKYSATFDLMSKVVISDHANRSAIYDYLILETGVEPSWNFGKYLVDVDGKPIAFFGSNINPTSDEITSRIETLLKR